ncbi:MAG: YlbF family regulator [Firmicutes bacterium]|nr:YlbF family regulator [Bacillota bacterium]
MSLTDKALDMCLELGRILAQTEEFKKMKDAEQNLMRDTEARKLVEDLQMLQAEHRRIQLSGQQLSEDDKKKAKEVEAVAMNHPAVKASFQANADFQAMMNKITSKIKEGIRENSRQASH